jgi:hypothetical protein
MRRTNIQITRWARATMASVLAVTIGACSLEVEREEGPAPTASVAHIEVDDVAAELAEHTVFDALSMAAYRRLDRMHETFAALTPAQKTSVRNALTACDQGAPGPCADELALLGFTPSLSPQESTWMDELLADTDLASLDLKDRREAFIEAQQLRDAATGNASWDDLVPSTVDGQPCGNACRTAFMAFFADPHADMLAAMSAFPSSAAWTNDAFAIEGEGPVPIGDLATDGIVAVAITAALVLISWCATHDCTPESPQSECSDDHECNSDEYCHRGFLGVGINECRPARGSGASCGRDEECLSDCCKGGFFGIGKECKPANDCD